MNDFRIAGVEGTETNEVALWLAQVDIESLRASVLEGMGWDDGDPIGLTVIKLIEMAEEEW